MVSNSSDMFNLGAHPFPDIILKYRPLIAIKHNGKDNKINDGAEIGLTNIHCLTPKKTLFLVKNEVYR